MVLNMTTSNIDLTEGLKNTIKEKTKKLDKLLAAEPNAVVEVRLGVIAKKPKTQRTEITVRKRKSVVRAEVETDDMYKSIAKAVDTVEERLKKEKEKKQVRAGMERVSAAMARREKEEKESPVKITRQKRFIAAIMTPEEACEAMEMTDHDFFLFQDSETDNMCVVYKKKNGEFGLLVAV